MNPEEWDGYEDIAFMVKLTGIIGQELPLYKSDIYIERSPTKRREVTKKVKAKAPPVPLVSEVTRKNSANRIAGIKYTGSECVHGGHWWQTGPKALMWQCRTMECYQSDLCDT